MLDTVRDQLLEINRRFYQSFGEAFAAKRGRPQPGVLRILGRMPPEAAVLDLGCGHGLIAAELDRAGHRGRYLGLDNSAELLRIAKGKMFEFPAEFRQADLASPEWNDGLRREFDWLLVFAVLHHLPGSELRRAFTRACADLLAPGGRMVVSVWDFLTAPDLRERILPWDRADLAPEQVQPGDYLIDWRHAGRGMRYVHHFVPRELAGLADSAGLSVVETFRSDGRNKRLGLYQIWSRSDG